MRRAVLSVWILALALLPDRNVERGAMRPRLTAPALAGALPDNPIVAENRRAGSSGWRIASNAGSFLEGFASRTSVLPGDQVDLYVSTAAPSYDVGVWRLGWYGGAGGRLVWERRGVPGVRQQPPWIDEATRMVEARWTPTLTVDVGRDWTTGSYVARLGVPDGRASYVPFTVLESGRRAPVVFQSSVTTWQAYNDWGGASLYAGRHGRSVVVSFDRPYAFGSGAGDLLGLEVPLLSWLERHGYDVAYVTNVDLHADAWLLYGRRAFLSLGHDEYWSTPMRDAVEWALHDGVNAAFFGANAMFRRIRLEDSPLGPLRRQVNWRSTADPMTQIDPAEATVQWRDPPVRRPEDRVLGAMYECNPVRGSTAVHDPLPWLFRDTGLDAGDRIHGIVGSEYDRVFRLPSGGGRLWLLFRGPVTCRGRPSVQDTTFLRLASGAGVFDAGTSNFLCVFDGCPGIPRDERVQTLVANMLDAYMHSSPPAERQPRPFTIGPPSAAVEERAPHRRAERVTTPSRSSFVLRTPRPPRTPSLP